MTDIYTDGETPVLNYAEAARTLAGLKHLSNNTLKAEAVSRVQAAALLDIAVTLNALINGTPFAEAREVGPDGEPMGDEEREADDTDVIDDSPLEVGDWVRPHPIDFDEATQLDPASKVLAVGVSEGAAWVELEHYDDDGEVLSSGVRAWAENYRPALVYNINVDNVFDEADEPEPVKPAKVKSGKGKNKNKGGQ